MFALSASPVMAPVATNLSPHLATTQLPVAQIPTIMNIAAPPASNLLAAVNQRENQQQTGNPSQAAANILATQAAAVASPAGLQLARPTQLEFGTSSSFLAQLLSQDIPGDMPTLQGFMQPLPSLNAAPTERFEQNAQIKYLPSLASKPVPQPAPQNTNASHAISNLHQNLQVNHTPVMAQNTPQAANLSTTQVASFLSTPVMGKAPVTSKTAPTLPTISLRNKAGVAAYQATIARTQQLAVRAAQDIPLAPTPFDTSEVEAVVEVKR